MKSIQQQLKELRIKFGLKNKTKFYNKYERKFKTNKDILFDKADKIIEKILMR